MDGTVNWRARDPFSIIMENNENQVSTCYVYLYVTSFKTYMWLWLATFSVENSVNVLGFRFCSRVIAS